ncbi:MAG: MIP/aquaporin family protein [Geminicoccaceae bacterium]
MSPYLSTRLIAEFIGTFALIFIGAGAGALGLGGVVGVAFAHGLVLAAFASGYGPVSGCHINPAVTVSVLVARRISPRDAGLYIVVQLLGGIVGGLLLRFVLGGAETGLGATVLAENLAIGDVSISVTPLAGLVLEIILTFFLANVVLNTAVAGRGGDVAALAIGLTLTFCILMGGPLTGASLNPARTIGPAIAAGIFSDIWLYIVGPVIGGIIAGLLYNAQLKDSA